MSEQLLIYRIYRIERVGQDYPWHYGDDAQYVVLRDGQPYAWTEDAEAAQHIVFGLDLADAKTTERGGGDE